MLHLENGLCILLKCGEIPLIPRSHRMRSLSESKSRQEQEQQFSDLCVLESPGGFVKTHRLLGSVQSVWIRPRGKTKNLYFWQGPRWCWRYLPGITSRVSVDLCTNFHEFFCFNARLYLRNPLLCFSIICYCLKKLCWILLTGIPVNTHIWEWKH